MDRPRHPHVVRTWVAERNRHPVHNIPSMKTQDLRHGAPRMAATPKAHTVPPTPHKEPDSKP